MTTDWYMYIYNINCEKPTVHYDRDEVFFPCFNSELPPNAANVTS